MHDIPIPTLKLAVQRARAKSTLASLDTTITVVMVEDGLEFRGRHKGLTATQEVSWLEVSRAHPEAMFNVKLDALLQQLKSQA